MVSGKILRIATLKMLTSYFELAIKRILPDTISAVSAFLFVFKNIQGNFVNTIHQIPLDGYYT